MEKKTLKILFVTDDGKLKTVLEFCFDGWGYEVFFYGHAGAVLDEIIKMSPDVIVIDANSATKNQLEICNQLKGNLTTAHIPVITLINKRQLREHLLSLSEGVDDYLIKPPDPLDLRIRVEMALKRSQHSFYANALTGLPGGIVIEETIKKKLEKNIPFVEGHVDIDNFKSFNDKYGYLKGDRIIMQAAYMLNTSIKKCGNRDDFIGHIGGDDFVFITTPDKYQEICRDFICMFDTIIPFHYAAEDRKNGYVTTRDRTNKLRKLPLMSVTIALVMKNSPKEVNSIIELNERIAEVKQYLKTMPGSKYMADRRITKKDDHLTLQVFNNDESLIENYKPLGQILIDKDLLTQEDLDNALKMHWKRGVLLGEVIKEMGLVSENDIRDALSSQENYLEAGNLKDAPAIQTKN